MPDRSRPSRFMDPSGALIVPSQMRVYSYLTLLSSDPAKARQLSELEHDRREADHHHTNPKDSA